MPKTKHRFIVTVTGASSQRHAMGAILYAFQMRNLGGPSFHAITEAQDGCNRRKREAREMPPFAYHRTDFSRQY
jgi:hypothetical protein